MLVCYIFLWTAVFLFYHSSQLHNQSPFSTTVDTVKYEWDVLVLLLLLVELAFPYIRPLRIQTILADLLIKINNNDNCIA